MAEESRGDATVRVVAIGSSVMGDDGVGAVVARLLRERPEAAGVDVIEGELAGMGLIPHFLTSGHVLVVDAMDAGAEPGSIFRFDPDEAGVTQLRSNNIHGMGLPYLVTNARLKGYSPQVLVFGVQVRDVAPVDELSPPVAAVVPRVVELMAEELRRLRGTQDAAESA
jgi:hydrogenase maturation protease